MNRAVLFFFLSLVCITLWGQHSQQVTTKIRTVTLSLEDATQKLLDLCIIIAQSTKGPTSRSLEKIIRQGAAHKKLHPISMQTLIKIVRYAGITLKICEIKKDMPNNRIQQISDLLETYWAAVWEQWHYKHVYPVNLTSLVRAMETDYAR